MNDFALTKIDKARLLLDEAKSVEDVKAVADMAECARIYARRAKASVEVINRAVAIKLMAERRAGEMLTGLERDRGGRPRKNPSHNVTGLSAIGVSRMQRLRWQHAAKVPEPKFREYIIGCTRNGKEATSSGLYKLANHHAPKNGAKQPTVEGICSDLSELISADQKFGTIYADPPWNYDNQSTRAATSNHYGSMTVAELCALPVAKLSADKCHLHLWITNAFLFEAPKIFKAWGFEFKSSFVWVKPQMGIGNYWRNSHEIMLLAVKGGQTALSKSERSWLECGRGLHSSKPEQVRRSIEKLSLGPYLELFGRAPKTGWTVFGNQIVPELVKL